MTIPFSFYFLHILPVRSRGSHMFLTVMSRMHIRRTAKKSFIKKLSWIHGKVFLASCESNSIRIRLSVTISHTSIEVICQSIRYIWHLWKKKNWSLSSRLFLLAEPEKTLETSYSPPILVIRDRSKDLFLLLQQVFEIKNASVSTSDHCCRWLGLFAHSGREVEPLKA